MELEKSINSSKQISDKILINCQDPSFYKLQHLMYKLNNNAIVSNAIGDPNINIVLKFNVCFCVKNEYAMSVHLDQFPNYIKYMCSSNCADNTQNILSGKDILENSEMCNVHDVSTGVLVMKYYPLGSVASYTWNEDNFELLKNVMVQVIFSALYAYETKYFVHRDMHARNVLLEPKFYDNIQYGQRTLGIGELQAVIMDFEGSIIGKKARKQMLNDIIANFISSIFFTDITPFVIDLDNVQLQRIKIIDDDDYDYYHAFYEIVTQASILT